MAKEPDWSEDRRCYGRSTKKVKGNLGKAKRCENYVRVGNYCGHHVAQDDGQLYGWEADPAWGLRFCNKPTKNGFCRRRPGVGGICQDEYYHSKFNLKNGRLPRGSSDSGLEDSNPIQPHMPPLKPLKNNTLQAEDSSPNPLQQRTRIPRKVGHYSSYPRHFRKTHRRAHPRPEERNIMIRDGTHRLGFYPHGQPRHQAYHPSSKTSIKIPNNLWIMKPPARDQNQATVDNGLVRQIQIQCTKRIVVRRDTDDAEAVQNVGSPQGKYVASRNSSSNRRLNPTPSEEKPRLRQPL